MSKWREMAKPHRRPRFKLAGCRRCGGDAFLDLLDGAEWRCLQCGRTLADEPGARAVTTNNGAYFKGLAGRPAA